MFYLLVRLLHDEMTEGKISKKDYSHAIEKIAIIHGFKQNGIK